MKSIIQRSIVYFTAVFFLASLAASIQLSLAQQRDPPMPPGKGRDKPLQRTLPRAEIYAKVSKDLGISDKDLKASVVALEEKGFLLRDALVMVMIAKARADQLTEKGKFTQAQAAPALQDSVKFLVEIVETEGVGWITLGIRAGLKEDVNGLMNKANFDLGITSQRAATSRTAEEKTAALPERKTALPPGGRAKGSIRHADVTNEKIFERDVILKNLSKELAIEPEKAKGYLTRLEAQMPIREAVMVLLVADGYAGRKIAKGEYSKQQRAEALLDGIEAILPALEKGEGWGDIGKRFGVEVSGVALNKKANAIIGQD